MAIRPLLWLFVVVPLLAACGAAAAVTPAQTLIPATATLFAAKTAMPPVLSVPPVSPVSTPVPTVIPPTVTPTPVPTLSPLAGNFSNQIARLEHAAPAAKSNLFVTPTDAEMVDFAALWHAISGGGAAQKQTLAAQHGYELMRYTDHGDTGAETLLLREKKPVRRGWGLFARRVAPQNSLIIEVPHPLFDSGTPAVALDVYRTVDALALLVAGAHRYANADGSADAAHNRQTIFQAIHQAATAGGAAIVLQIHGFSTVNHPGYPQIVLGGNSHPESVALTASLADKLKNAGLSVGVCGLGQWQKLCGTQNLQGETMSAGGFVHIELSESVRQDDRSFVAALAKEFGKNPGGN